ncbi:SapC family protein [Frateuria aurantia]
MAEMLFYQRPVPLNRVAHKDLRMKPVAGAKFAAKVHSIPLTGVEFPMAARDLPVLFAGPSADQAGPIALLGLREEENLFVDAGGNWISGTYVPAFVRRYPFVLAEKPPGQPGDDFAVFLDEAFEGFSQTEGERLFKEDGSDSETLTRAVNFLGEFQGQVTRTQWFLEQLRTHKLLEPQSIRLDKKEGESVNLNGLFIVSEERLRKLDAATAEMFLREGVLGWIYAHLISLANIDRLTRRLSEREDGEQTAAG